MEPGTQFLLTEVLVACSAVFALLGLLAFVFFLEHHTPGPVFSHKALRDNFGAQARPVPATPAPTTAQPHEELAA